MINIDSPNDWGKTRPQRGISAEYCGGWSRDAKSDNAPAHNAISVRQLLVKKEITSLDHPCLIPKSSTMWVLALTWAENCSERNSLFILKWNQERSDEGAEEPPGRRVCQMLPRVAGTNAEVH